MGSQLRATRRKAAPRSTPVEMAERAVLDVTVVLLEDGYASTAIGPIEVFHSAGTLWNWLHGETTQPRFRVRTASIDGGSVTAICQLGLKPELAIKDIKHTDIIILPASGWDVIDRIAKSSALIPWLRKWHKRGAYIAGICTGAAFLAEAGILDGHQATTHWGLAELLRERYPKVLWQPDQFLTEDRGIFCSGGIYASIDLSLYLVEKFCGHEVALQVARSLLVSMPRHRQAGYSVLPLSRPHADDKIHQAEQYLQQHFVRGVPIDTLAERIGMSPRNFIRRFKSATGRLPGAYLQMLRMSSAREMLEQGDTPIQKVCTRSGYEDAAFFRRVFKRHTGMTPAEYRSRFAGMDVNRGELVVEARPRKASAA
jgi:transcriptional regulator GlxA family with amidase domain